MSKELIFDILSDNLTYEHIKHLMIEHAKDLDFYDIEFTTVDDHTLMLDLFYINVFLINDDNIKIKFDFSFTDDSEYVQVEPEAKSFDTSGMSVERFKWEYFEHYNFMKQLVDLSNYKQNFPDGGYEHDL